MIIWRGFGILVAIAGFIGFIVAELITRGITNSDTYYQAHSLPRLGGAVLGAVLAFGAVKLLKMWDKPRIVIDKATGREMVLRRGDSLFFVPARFWPYIIFVIGVVVAFINE
jgi:hypothetical protein